MSKRAHELAKELQLESKELLTLAKSADVDIKNHMSNVSEEDIQKIYNYIEARRKQSVKEKRVSGKIIRRRRKPVKAIIEPVEEEKPEEEETPAVSEGATTAKAYEEPDAEAEKEEQSQAAEVVEEQVEEIDDQEAEQAEAQDHPEQAVEAEPVGEAETEAKSEPEAQPEPAVGEAVMEDAVQEAADEPAKAEEPPAPKKKKPRRHRQIAKIVDRVDLEDMEPAAKPQKEQQRGQPNRRSRYQPSRRSPQQQQAQQTLQPPSIIQPIIDDKRRKKTSTNPYEEEEAASRRKKGTRKRKIIDDSYLNRRGRGVKRRGDRGENRQSSSQTTPKAIKRVIRLATETIVVGELAKRMGVKATELILKLMQMGLRVNVNQAIDFDTASILASEFNFEVESTAFEEEQILSVPQEEDDDKQAERAPVVTVMGHVDHGKTSILDYIRKTKVASGEAGGITQHIGAYQVKRKRGMITFLDTPGHEAFTSMRSRGAQITDIVILVVAADDGVMPQTIEAIRHAKAAEVPMIVAVNKIDKPNAAPDKVRNELMQQSVIPEDLGGDTIFVDVSAKTGDGIDTLLEMVILQAEMLELLANPEREHAEAIVVEGRLDKGRGPVGTVLVRQGSLKVGDSFVCGAQSSKIKALIDDKGGRIKEAGPSVPVEVLGFDEVPDAGEVFNTLKDEKQAKLIAENRYRKKRDTELAKTSKVSLEELVSRAKSGDKKNLSIVLKGDVHGTVEALKDSLQKQSTDEVEIETIMTGVGGINESDVLFAAAGDAMIIGFNVRAEAKAQSLAEQEGVEIKTYTVIYDVLDDIKSAVLGLSAPKIREEIVGNVEVRDTFVIPKVGTIAGCYVTNGRVKKNDIVRIYRDNVMIYQGKIGSLRRFKDDVGEVAHGYECGISIDGYNDIKVGDIFEMVQEVEIMPEL